MKNVNAIVLSATSASSRNGSLIDANQIYQVSFQTVFAAVDAAGDLKIQMSNDMQPAGMIQNNFAPTNWSDIPNATAAVVSGAAPPIILSIVSARWLRIVFTRSGGATGAITSTMFALCV